MADAQYRVVGIVRDATGKPKFDDVNAIPEQWKAAYRAAMTAEDVAKLTPEERKGLGYGDHTPN